MTVTGLLFGLVIVVLAGAFIVYLVAAFLRGAR